MPPTKRWQNSKNDKNSGASLQQLISAEIASNNCLGLVADEIPNMVKLLSECTSREEVFQWSQTLMLGDEFANMIIKKRESTGPPFSGEKILQHDPTPSLEKAFSPEKASQATITRSKNKSRAQVSFKSAALKKGCHECGCFGLVHNVVRNCTNCGRIICEQESLESCYFCGLEPKTCFTYEIKLQEGKLTEAAIRKDKESYQTAIKRRDNLLEFAKTRAKRTSVVDDQAATLFSTQSAWLSPEERKSEHDKLVDAERKRKIEEMHKKKGSYMVHLDLNNQNISLGARDIPCTDPKDEENGSIYSAASKSKEEESETPESDVINIEETRAQPIPSLLQKIWYNPSGTKIDDSARPVLQDEKWALPDEKIISTVERVEEISKRVQQNYFEDDLVFFHIQLDEAKKEQLVFSVDHLVTGHDQSDEDIESIKAAAEESDRKARLASPLSSNRFTLSDALRNKDEGICLTMHQPWASLLVRGIKVHEGRVWSTPYRGRLWIHAASVEPHDVAETEQHYSRFKPRDKSFPEHYPTRVLLGYVYVVDCLALDQYNTVFEPEKRQEQSPFSFICIEPKELLFPLPMEGNHKLYKLEHKVHTAAKRQLQEI